MEPSYEFYFFVKCAYCSVIEVVRIPIIIWWSVIKRLFFCFWYGYNFLSGQFYYIDTRKNEPVISKKVHDGGARSVVQSYYTKGLLSTCGEDGVIFFMIVNTNFKINRNFFSSSRRRNISRLKRDNCTI